MKTLPYSDSLTQKSCSHAPMGRHKRGLQRIDRPTAHSAVAAAGPVVCEKSFDEL